MHVQITKTTDSQYVGAVFEVPGVSDFGVLTLQQIQMITSQLYGGQFEPTYVFREGSKTRLVSSNYSVELEKING